MQRRGVVGGIDYGSTGEVKRIDASSIKERLNSDIVIVSNMGYSSAGEVLNCKYVDHRLLSHRYVSQLNFHDVQSGFSVIYLLQENELKS